MYGRRMLRSVRGWFWRSAIQCHYTLGEMTIHTGDPPWLSTKGPHIPVNMIRHTESQHSPGRTVSHTGGPHFHKGIPYSWENGDPESSIIIMHVEKIWSSHLLRSHLHLCNMLIRLRTFHNFNHIIKLWPKASQSFATKNREWRIDHGLRRQRGSNRRVADFWQLTGR